MDAAARLAVVVAVAVVAAIAPRRLRRFPSPLVTVSRLSCLLIFDDFAFLGIAYDFVKFHDAVLLEFD